MLTKVEFLEKVAVIKLDRPGTNSLNHEILDNLLDCLNLAESRKDISVVILSSSLSFGFSSGLDLGSYFVRNDKDKTCENIFAAVQKVYEINSRIINSQKVYIAGISGPVIGSAASIVFACDLRIAADNTWFWMPDPQYGGLLADGGVELLCELVGYSRAAMLALTNDRINVKTASDWGLIYQVVPKQELENKTFLTAKRISQYSDISLGLTKKIIDKKITASQKEMLKEVLISGDAFGRLETFISKKQ